MVLVPENDSLRSKAKKVTDALAKTVRVKNQAKVKKWLVTPTPPGVVPNPPSTLSTAKELSSTLPPLYQAKGERLLNEMITAGFSWNPSKELVLPSTEPVVNSNIESILREALVRGHSVVKPTGWKEFIDEISRSTVPLDLLTKKSTQQALSQTVQRAWEMY
jgi:hypothetical protein